MKTIAGLAMAVAISIAPAAPRADALAGYRLESTTGEFEHWVNPTYLADGRVLDIDRPEGLLLVREGSARVLVARVYVVDRTDAPTPVIPHGTWHHHTLCQGAGGLGVPLPDGPCPPNTQLTDTPPMLHVWVPGTDALAAQIDGSNFCRL